MHTRAWFFLLCLGSLLTGCRSKHLAIEQMASVQRTQQADTLRANVTWLILDSIWQLDTMQQDSFMPKLQLYTVRRINIQKKAESSSRSCSMRADSSAYLSDKTSFHKIAFENDNSINWLLIKLAVASILILVLVRHGKKMF